MSINDTSESDTSELALVGSDLEALFSIWKHEFPVDAEHAKPASIYALLHSLLRKKVELSGASIYLASRDHGQYAFVLSCYGAKVVGTDYGKWTNNGLLSLPSNPDINVGTLLEVDTINRELLSEFPMTSSTYDAVITIDTLMSEADEKLDKKRLQEAMMLFSNYSRRQFHSLIEGDFSILNGITIEDFPGRKRSIEKATTEHNEKNYVIVVEN